MIAVRVETSVETGRREIERGMGDIDQNEIGIGTMIGKTIDDEAIIEATTGDIEVEMTEIEGMIIETEMDGMTEPKEAIETVGIEERGLEHLQKNDQILWDQPLRNPTVRQNL